MNNLDLMRQRLMWQGGIQQENRMIHDKFRTLQRVMAYSYQACTVQKVQPYSEVLPYNANIIEDIEFPMERALINSDKVKQDYDDKIISLPYEAGFVPGDVFEWKKTDTQWIIYTQEITEDAYFRGEIRRCRYKINFIDEQGNWCSTFAAIRGPVETKIDSIQKNQIRVDRPNLSLNILIPRNEKTLAAFDRYEQFIFEGKSWRIQAPDSISMTNVIELAAEEYYIDKDTDLLTEDNQGMKNGLVIEPIDPNPIVPDDETIIGETFIRPQIEEIYTAPEEGGEWCILEKFPVCITAIDGASVKVIWQKMTSGQFTLLWSKGNKIINKTIVVESLF